MKLLAIITFFNVFAVQNVISEEPYPYQKVNVDNKLCSKITYLNDNCWKGDHTYHSDVCNDDCTIKDVMWRIKNIDYHDPNPNRDSYEFDITRYGFQWTSCNEN